MKLEIVIGTKFFLFSFEKLFLISDLGHHGSYIIFFLFRRVLHEIFFFLSKSTRDMCSKGGICLKGGFIFFSFSFIKCNFLGIKQSKNITFGKNM